MPLGIEVVTRESVQSGGASLSTGTAFVVGAAEFGPETPQQIRSLSEFAYVYGPRSTISAKLYDAVNTFFATGGGRAYVQRAGTTAGVAKLELESSGGKKALIVSAVSGGTYGNGFKVEVKENPGKTKTTLLIYNSASELVESSGEYAEVKELFVWGETHKTYVNVTEGSEYTAAKTEKLKALALKVLAGGTNPTVNAAAYEAAIEAFPKTLGAGQLIVPGNTEEPVHTAMGEHASKNNRFAICDLKKAEEAGSTAANIVSEKGTYGTAIAGYMAFTASSAIALGTTLGTTRTVAGSSVVAGLCARVAKTNNDNQAPAGEQWSLAPFVVGFTNVFNKTDSETLNNAGINNFAEVNGIPCLFGFRTALSKELNSVFWQASASRERMHLVAQGEVLLSKYLFHTIDGRHQLEAALQGSLQGMIKEHWLENALFGERPDEAGKVNVQSPVNTDVTRANGELNAELEVRMSPFAEFVKLVIVTVPVAEALI